MNSTELNQAQSTFLDCARASAAMFVLFGHAAMMFLNGSVLGEMNIQTFGVLVFFLLSGFLISFSVFRKYDDKSYSFTAYFIDRFCRIYCAFLPALIFVWIVDFISLSLPLELSPEEIKAAPWISDMQENFNLVTWLGNALMMQDFPLFQVARLIGVPENKFFIDEFGSASPFWTICIEWWIYMLFGAVVVYWMKDKKKFTPLKFILLLFVAITPVYYAVGGHDNCLTLLWLLGMIASLIYLNFSRWIEAKGIKFSKSKWMLIFSAFIAGGIICMLARLISLKLDTGSANFAELQFSLFLAISLFSAVLLFGNVDKANLLFKKFITFVADYSYSLYLTHATVLTYLYVKYPGHDYDLKFFFLAIVASNIVAIIFWYLFERHHRKVAKFLKQRFVKAI